MRYAGAGMLAGLAGVAVSGATAALLRQRLSPPDAVAEAVIEVTPGPVALYLIHLVGRWDKPLLMAGVLAGLLVLSALAGLSARRGLWRGQLLFCAVAAVAVAAVVTRPGGDLADLAPVVLGALAWTSVLGYLAAVLGQRSAGSEATGRDEVAGATGATRAEIGPPDSRRSFLTRVGVVGAGTLAVAVGGRLFGRRRSRVEEARARLRLPVSGGEVPEDAEVEVDGVTPWRVDNGDFYQIHTALAVPAIDVSTWRLRIHGMVRRELRLTYQDLLDRGLTEAWVTLACVSNPVGGELIGNAWWSGIRIADLLAEAGPAAGADAVLQTSEDGWTCGTPLAALTDDRDAMLALAMNGEPLPLEHGFPVRMVVPGLYGYVSATKWLVDLEVTRFDDISAYWTQRGWSAEGPVRTQSRIDVPRANHGVRAGDLRVAGVAWAQHTGIEKVEISLDGGPWTTTELGGVPSVDTWVQWSGTVQAEPGNHKVSVRATDRSGYTQTAVRRDVVPDGATGWHTIDFTAE